MKADNPLSYPPFMFEGHTPEERSKMLGADFSMMVVRIGRK
jgi:hypothetical protein